MGGQGMGGLREDRAALDKYLAYDENHRIVVCLTCGYCIVSESGTKRHLKDFHTDWPLQLRKDIVKHVAQFSLACPDDICPPDPPESAIFGLTTYDGWRCMRCKYCSPSEGTMLEHNKEAHCWTKAQRPCWRPAKVQTFFSGSRRRFFEVIEYTKLDRDGHADLASAVQILLDQGKAQDERDAKDAAKTDSDQIPSDNTPWIRKTRWAKKFAGRDLFAVSACCAKPSKDEGSLLLVWNSVHRVLERCRASIADWHEHEEDGDVVLGWLNSSQVDKCNPEPFSTYYEKSTHVKYANWWAQGICYCLRAIHAADSHGHAFSGPEEEALHKIWDLAELGCEDDTVLDSSVFDLSVLLWTHEGRAHSKSAVVHFSAIFGIDNHKGCYRLPPVYGQILAALLYCARLLLFEHALPADKREHVDDPCSRLLDIHHQWLVDGRATPFHYLDNLLAYALGAGNEVGGKPRVQWSKDRQTLIHQGQRLPLCELRSFVNDLCGAAEDVLFKDLMFQSDLDAPRDVDLRQVADDMNETSVGYHFVSDPRNSLHDGRERMLKRLTASSRVNSLLHLKSGKIELQPEEWRKYRLQLQHFLSILFILIHTSNVPARGVEILPIRYSNAPEAPRNIFVHDGHLIIVTAYHKSQAITGHQKVIARFLGRRISRLLASYLVEVQPFVALVDREWIPRAARCFLWADEKGIWNTPRATKALVRESATRLSSRITIQDYRHIAKAIDREHVRGLGGGVEDEGDVMHDLAAAHTPQTADAVYGIDASMLRSLSARTLLSFRTVSDRWHQFWRMDTSNGGSVKVHSRALSSTAEMPVAKRSQTHLDPCTELRSGLLHMIGPNANFKNSEQEEAVLAVHKGYSPLVIVLPPGGGKSLAFQLPASLSSAGTTIVILPFRALTKDLVKRCRGLGLRSEVWTGQQQRSPQIIFVGAETAAVNDDFLTFASDLQVKGRLDRIIVDECQVPLTSASYRSHLMHLDRLRSIPCQMVLLTGTLPPLLKAQLEDIFLLGTAEQGLRYIRASTNRPNVRYSVEVYNDAEVESKVCAAMQHARRDLLAGQRAVIFCRSRATCERTARQLDCQLYHRTFEEREESLATWIDGSEKVMVATSALGTGVDIDGIRIVLHLNRPHGIIDFVQEVGRAGRDGEPVQSKIILGKREAKWLRSEAAVEAEWNREGLRQFLVEHGCRRARLGAIMDGKEVTCGDQGGLHCDSCLQADGREERARVADKEISKAEEQEKRYAVGPQLWQARVRQQAEQRGVIEWAVSEIGPQCAACWVLRKADGMHRPEGCPWLTALITGDYWTKRRSIRFEQDCRCCYHCSLPGDWCPFYSQGQKCVRADIITPIVFAGWGLETTCKTLQQEVGSADVDRLITWMGKASRLGGVKAPNSVRAAETIIQSVKTRRHSEM